MVDDQTRDDTSTVPTASGGSRALVTTQAPRVAPGGDDRPMAGFVAQLIACHRRFPAYRKAGRADPGEATRIYGGEAGRGTVRIDRAV